MIRTRFLRVTHRAAWLGLSLAWGVGLSAALELGHAGVAFAVPPKGPPGLAGKPEAANPGPAKPAAAAPATAATSATGAAGSGGASEASEDTPEQRLAKRRERLEQAAKRLRERAAQLRQEAAQPSTAADPKRAGRNPQEQAQKLEEQANKMEERAKNLTLQDVRQRSPEAVRANRHRLRRAHLNRRWGAPTLRDPEAQAELKVHAERVAKLKRIEALARAKSGDDPALARARALLAREDERHEQHMKAIQSRVAPAAASTAKAAPEEAK